MHGVTADLVPVLARIAVSFIRNAIQRKLRVHPLFFKAELHPVGLCVGLQGRCELLRSVDAALRNKGKMPLVLHLCQRAVILQPARAERTLYGRLFHPGQAGIHIKRFCLRPLPGKVGTKLHGCRQMRGLLLQHGLLGLQRLLQGLFPAQHRLDGGQRHIQHPQHSDEPESADVLFCVVAVIVAGQPGRVQKPLFFIEADIGGGHPALFRSLFDVHLLHLRTHITP